MSNREVALIYFGFNWHGRVRNRNSVSDYFVVKE